MRHLLAILALFITGTLACQVVVHTLPQNEDGGEASSCTPLDSNGDNLVGVSDLMDLLARFGDSDLDEDGIWDSEDDCVGVLDECGVCNGPGPNAIVIDTILVTYDSIYVSQIDLWYVFEVDADTLFSVTCGGDEAYCDDPSACNWQEYEGCDYSCIGCMDPSAANYNPWAVVASNCMFCEPGTFVVSIEASLLSGVELSGTYSFSVVGSTSVVVEGIFDNATSNGETAVESVCINPGCYLLSYAFDGDFDASAVSVYDQFGTQYAQGFPSTGAVNVYFGVDCD